MEQGTGIEPAFTAWEAVVLPIYEPCVFPYYTRGACKKQALFVAARAIFCAGSGNRHRKYTHLQLIFAAAAPDSGAPRCPGA